jgi:hypothetical protein
LYARRRSSPVRCVIAASVDGPVQREHPDHPQPVLLGQQAEHLRRSGGRTVVAHVLHDARR